MERAAKTPPAGAAKPLTPAPPRLSLSNALILQQLLLVCAARRRPWDEREIPFHSHAQTREKKRQRRKVQQEKPRGNERAAAPSPVQDHHARRLFFANWGETNHSDPGLGSRIADPSRDGLGKCNRDSRRASPATVGTDNWL